MSALTKEHVERHVEHAIQKFELLTKKLRPTKPRRSSNASPPPGIHDKPTDFETHVRPIGDRSHDPVNGVLTTPYAVTRDVPALLPRARHKQSPRPQSSLAADSSVPSIATDAGYDDLVNQVAEAMDEYKIGLSVNDIPKNYMPDSQCRTLADRKNVVKALPETIVRASLPTASYIELIDFIVKEAPRTFLITLLVMLDAASCARAMWIFKKHHFVDQVSLPVSKITDKKPGTVQRCIYFSGPNDIECQPCAALDEPVNHEPSRRDSETCDHKHVHDCFHHKIWDRTRFNAFFEKQWAFVLHRFDFDVFKYEAIEEQRILPFFMNEAESLHSAGNFSEVRRAHMLASYFIVNEDLEQSLSRGQRSRDGQPVMDVAIKTLKNLTEEGYDVEVEWQKELEAYQELNALKHKHIVRGLGAFHQRNNRHLLLEWADGDSLQMFWEKEPHPEFTRQNVLELLRQLCGLTDALHAMHNTEKVRSLVHDPRNKSSISQKLDVEDPSAVATDQADSLPDDTASLPPLGPTITISGPVDHSSRPKVSFAEPEQDQRSTSSAKTTNENWRHGDIKPGNILRFKDDECPWLGRLKLADLGRAKKHLASTKMRSSVEIDEWTTEKYEPPDVYMYGLERSMSRLFDVWSLGCVFFEAVVWLLYGQTEYHNFKNTSRLNGMGNAKLHGTPYWTQVTLKLGQSTAQVSHLASMWMSHILHNDPECQSPSAIRDLVHLIQDRMLVVRLPEDSDETSADARVNAAELLEQMKAILERAEDDDQYLFTKTKRVNVQAPPSGVEAIVNLSHAPSASLGLPGKSAHLKVPRLNGRWGPSTTRKRESEYRHALTSKWTFEEDSRFARQTLASMPEQTMFHNALPKALCKACKTMDFTSKSAIIVKVADIKKNKSTPTRCALCPMLWERAKAVKLDRAETFELERLGGWLKFRGIAAPLLRISRSLGSSDDLGQVSDIPIGICRLPQPAEDEQIQILQAWLEDCSKNHTCLPSESKNYCPRRLLYVGEADEEGSDVPDDEDGGGSSASGSSASGSSASGSSDNEPSCRLVETHLWTEQERSRQYLALSHPWGAPAKDTVDARRNNDDSDDGISSDEGDSDDSRVKVHFKTTRSNLQAHLERIDEEELPENFRNAIDITRKLGIKYLWVDSICIMQEEAGDPGDFAMEESHMQDIFSSAHCVIAASSASDMWTGFLQQRRDPRSVSLNKSNVVQSRSLMITDVVDDFERDVIKSRLNSRAWVLQERALARRTIYFTDNQAYWECRDGVRCETLSKIRSQDANFLGDSDFPSYAMQGGHNLGAQLYLFSRLYEQYSRLKLTHWIDRPVAIAALEQRLTKVFAESSGAGVFQSHSGRWLLWERASDVGRLSRIQFSASTYKQGSDSAETVTKVRNPPPSWSWMSHTGGIAFLDPPGGHMTWNNELVLHLTGTAEVSWLSSEEKLRMQAPVLNLTQDAVARIANDPGQGDPTKRSQREWSITLDDPEHALPSSLYVVKVGTAKIGKDTTHSTARHYVLVVVPKAGSEPLAFQRVGAGWVPTRFLDNGDQAGLSYIV